MRLRPPPARRSETHVVRAWACALLAAAAAATTLGACEIFNPAPPTPDGGGCNGESRSRCVAGVSLGARFGCALLGDQTVWCWGRNDENQLGYESTDLCPESLGSGGTRAIACHMHPLQVAGLQGATSLSTGRAHACVVVAGGGVRCWGGNTTGQLGNGSALPSVTPVDVTGVARASAVAAGASHACAIVEGGAVRCWGANDRGQLGVADAPAQCAVGGAMVPCARTPVAVTGVREAVEIVAGDAHTCVRTMVGRVVCWGTNVDGELGVGTADPMPGPRPRLVLFGTDPLARVRALAAGASHTCALREDGAVLCWGRHDRGQLGVPVPEMFEPCAHACVTAAVPVVGYAGDGTGGDPDGEGPDTLPDGGATPRGDGGAAPRDASASGDAGVASDARTDARVDGAVDAGPPAPPAPTVTSIAAGGAFSCLALSDGTVRCWGSNRNRELGSGGANEGGAALVTVIAAPGAATTNPLQNVRAVEAGGATSCAVLNDRSVRCWGSNEHGALGIGNTTEQNGPVPMTW